MAPKKKVEDDLELSDVDETKASAVRNPVAETRGRKVLTDEQKIKQAEILAKAREVARIKREENRKNGVLTKTEEKQIKQAENRKIVEEHKKQQQAKPTEPSVADETDADESEPEVIIKKQKSKPKPKKKKKIIIVNSDSDSDSSDESDDEPIIIKKKKKPVVVKTKTKVVEEDDEMSRMEDHMIKERYRQKLNEMRLAEVRNFMAPQGNYTFNRK